MSGFRGVVEMQVTGVVLTINARKGREGKG